MNRIVKNIILLSIIMLFAFVISCEKEPKTPIGTTNQISFFNTQGISIDSIDYTSVKLSLSIINNGDKVISEHGFCWDTITNPDNNKNTFLFGKPDSIGTDNITLKLSELKPGTDYYVRGFIQFNDINVYTDQKIVSTIALSKATVLTSQVTNITDSTAEVGGEITHLGGTEIIQNGLCWAEELNPDLESFVYIDTSNQEKFSNKLSGLKYNTEYFVRAYAINSVGISYGNEVSFTAGKTTPIVTTKLASDITDLTASSGGNVVEDGGSSVTLRGICWSTSPSPEISDNQIINGSGIGDFSISITGLLPNTLHYLRAFATNENGTSYGNEIQFTTLASLPSITTTSISGITGNSAVSGGNITSDGNDAVTVRGVCWSTSSNPTVDNFKTIDGTGTGAFTSSISGLSLNTSYYVRAYAENSVGIVYGNEISFSTNSGLAVVTTSPMTDVFSTNAKSGGNVSTDGGFVVTSRGVCWNTSPDPTIANSKTIDNIGTGVFISNIAGLTISTTYYVRAYATNANATVYGNQRSFTTENGLPQVMTGAILDVNATDATTGGDVIDNGGSPITAKGVCWSTSTGPTIADNITNDGTGTGTYASLITGLSLNTTYYVKAYATNSNGTKYGSEQSFTTDDGLAQIITNSISGIIDIEATTGGNITSDGGFVITARGVCWSLSPNPTTADNITSDGTGSGAFISTITGLSSKITYYVRAYCTNSSGTVYGNEEIFTTTIPPCPFSVTDYDGNVYGVVKIGLQCWTDKNIEATHYSDGTAIPNVELDAEWDLLDENGKAWAYYENSISYGDIYGVLYTWAAAMNGDISSNSNPSGIQGVCPLGWHLPSWTEWEELINYLGESLAGAKLKETGTTHWWSPNDGATNEYGFTALGGCERNFNGVFNPFLKEFGEFWTSTENGALNAYFSYFYHSSTDILISNNFKEMGHSVRCLRD